MQNFPLRNNNPPCQRLWPWERSAAVFAPSPDLLQNGWFHGSWRTARHIATPNAAGWSRVERGWNDAHLIASIQVYNGSRCAPSRSIALDYDRSGRLVEVFEVHGTRRSRLAFQYDAAGRVIRESSVELGGDDDTPRVGIAESFHDAAGRIRRVVARDRDGVLRECRLYNTDGSHIQTRLYDKTGRLETMQRYSYDARRRMAVLQEIRFTARGPDGSTRAESRQTDVSWYDARGGLLRREILDERSRDAGGAAVSWNRVVSEVVQYDGTAERPVSDHCRYFDQWQNAGQAETVFQIVIDYQYDRDLRLIRTTTTEHDLLLGTVLPHVTLHEHRSAGTPVIAESCRPGVHLPDRRVLHEYRPDGNLSRRRVFEGLPLLETQTVIYE